MIKVELVCADNLTWMRAQPADRFDLVFGSPPYLFARTYGMSKEWQWWDDFETYVDHMLEVSTEAARICKGPVIWVMGCPTRDRNYYPVAEALMVKWFQTGGDCHMYRPCVYYRVGIPGSGGDDWFRADWEYIICLKRPGKLPWSDNTACGHEPKYGTGGAMSNRNKDGTRVTHRRQPERNCRTTPEKANPGNVFHFVVGGGNIGDQLAHENEAPFPEGLPEIFILSCCPPGGWVLDPFVGSGTTCEVAQWWGRNSVGVDVRESQIELCRKRLRWGLKV